MKNILKYICLFSMLVWFFPVCVHADQSYVEIGSSYAWGERTSNTTGTTDYAFLGLSDGTMRAVFYTINNDANRIYGGWIYKNTDNIIRKYSLAGWVSSAPSSYGQNFNNVNFNNENYKYYISSTYLFILNYTKYSYNFNVPVLNFDHVLSFQELYDLTYGVPEPTPEPINWGLLRDVEYSTRIAGNGSAAIRNVDYLKWDTVADANGNDISECEVEIQAVPGNFSGSTYENLLNQTYQNFNIGNYGAVNLGTLPASSGTFSVSWSYILNHLGWSMDSLYAHFENELWLKTGWYYQIRLIGSDDYIGQWQTMYTPLSQGAAASETVINQNSFNMNIYQVYEKLTQINNNTSITINIEDTDYTVQNPDDGDEPQDGTDLWDILKQMLNGIFQIVKNIAALPGKLFDMIRSLFIMPDAYNFGDQLDSEINSYIENNQPGLLAIQEGTADIRETLEDTAPAGSGQYPQCIFTWDAVQLDLSAFNAGTVTFFAAGSFDFTAAFIQMIEGFGMSYSDYQFYVSAVIYLWLVVFIYRHVNTFLKGGGETKSG